MNWIYQLPKWERSIEIQSNKTVINTLMKKKKVLKSSYTASRRIKGNGIAPGHKAEETIHITQFMCYGWGLFGQMQK